MQQVFDFSTFQEEIFPRWLGRFKVGPGLADYSFRPGGQVDSYGVADALICLSILNETCDLTEAERDVWGAAIQRFQDPHTGRFTRTYTGHFWEHTTAYSTAALKLIQRRPAHPMAWKEAILRDEAAMVAWTRQWTRAPWSLIWPGSHIWSGVPAALTMTGEGTPEFFDWYFMWLDGESDPRTGFWRRGWLHRLVSPWPHPQDLFGAFHMFCLYTHAERPWQHPERVVDWTLGFQRPENGLWGRGAMYCRDLDGIYCLVRSSRLAGGYRGEEVRAAVTRALATAEAQLCHWDFVLRHYPNTHRLTGALAAVAECQRAYPELVMTPKPWIQTLDVACFI